VKVYSGFITAKSLQASWNLEGENLNARRLVFSLLLLNFAVGAVLFLDMTSNMATVAKALPGFSGWLSTSAFLQLLGSLCMVCLAYWVATDKKNK
jgi:hypothetical protein